MTSHNKAYLDWTDGCGLAMRVLTWDGSCFRGGWDRWGLRFDGAGYFCLCEAPSNELQRTRPAKATEPRR
jgi:hypothetical protein